jgi:hypothetical protein
VATPLSAVGARPRVASGLRSRVYNIYGGMAIIPWCLVIVLVIFGQHSDKKVVEEGGTCACQHKMHPNHRIASLTGTFSVS